MGNFEKLSVLVIVVIIVMILVVAIYTWQENPAGPETAQGPSGTDTPIENSTRISPWGNGEDPRPDVPEPIPAPDRPTPPENDVPPVDLPVPQPEPGPDQIRATTDPDVDNEPWIHEVKAGEVLGVIAQKYTGSTSNMGKIMALNPGMDPDHLDIGQKIKMPARGQVGPALRRGGPGNGGPGNVGPGPVRGGDPVAGSTYTTRRGDRLDNIAKLAYDNVERWPEIFAINKEKVTDPFRLAAGLKLKLPR